MQVSSFRGTGVALITPFDAHGAVDFDALRRVLLHTHAQGKGVNYWVVMGTTGESVTLKPSERQQLLDFVEENNPANLPLVYGWGGNDTQALLSQLPNLRLEGVQALMSVSPYYNKPSQKGLIAHYTALAEAAPRPLILYNVPGRTACNMLAETTLRLAEHPNIIGVKEASGDLLQCLEIARHKPKDFLLLSGEDMLTLPVISLGGDGVISVMANAFPVLFSEMVRAALEGDFARAQAALYLLAPLNPLMYEESNPVGVKQALALQGVCAPYVRLPLVPASEALKAKLQQVMLPA
ncbi:MAG: 4-hydroxy-tetrahydrodipicolinate synthase [Microscillaceae bacterium]|nr:4-hydroxy-tetrahydrodipicolinate synthase [Microscillaceae bacterium]